MNPQAAWTPAAPGNYARGRANRISRITFHHIVGDAPGAINRFQTPGVQVSSTYVIGSNGALYQCVREEDTPFTDANSDSNSRSITIEHAGPPYSEAMYQTSIRLVRQLIQKYGINDFKRHRDVSQTPTACPGQLNVERIINEARKEDEEMLDASHQSSLFVAYLGRLPEPAEVQRDVGKKTTDTMINELQESSEYASKRQRDNAAYEAKKVLDEGFEPVTGEIFRAKEA